jgi:hypothetical protein
MAVRGSWLDSRQSTALALTVQSFIHNAKSSYVDQGKEVSIRFRCSTRTVCLEINQDMATTKKMSCFKLTNLVYILRNEEF